MKSEEYIPLTEKDMCSEYFPLPLGVQDNPNRIEKDTYHRGNSNEKIRVAPPT